MAYRPAAAIGKATYVACPAPTSIEKGDRLALPTVRQHGYAAHGSTGWHAHPGPVFITVVEGTLAFYEYDDPTCTPRIVTAGQGYVDTGHGHLGLNPTEQPALDISVILAPVAGPFRGELPAPNPHCGF